MKDHSSKKTQQVKDRRRCCFARRQVACSLPEVECDTAQEGHHWHRSTSKPQWISRPELDSSALSGIHSNAQCLLCFGALLFVHSFSVSTITFSCWVHIPTTILYRWAHNSTTCSRSRESTAAWPCAPLNSVSVMGGGVCSSLKGWIIKLYCRFTLEWMTGIDC